MYLIKWTHFFGLGNHNFSSLHQFVFLPVSLYDWKPWIYIKGISAFIKHVKQKMFKTIKHKWIVSYESKFISMNLSCYGQLKNSHFLLNIFTAIILGNQTNVETWCDLNNYWIWPLKEKYASIIHVQMSRTFES